MKVMVIKTNVLFKSFFEDDKSTFDNGARGDGEAGTAANDSRV